MNFSCKPTLMAIGGAINLKHPILLQDFYRRAGGRAARLVVLPTASELPEAGEAICRLWQELGVTQSPVILNIRNRQQAYDQEIIRQLGGATGIFLAGGVQLRLTSFLGGTPLHQALLNASKQGAIIGGTSAGAAALSAIMIAYGRGGATPRHSLLHLSPGLGFTDQVIFDQHFRQRDRLGRLMLAVSMQPGMIGAGIDENTAAILEGNLLTVQGQSAVTIVDGSQIEMTDVAEKAGRQPVATTHLIVHILTACGSYNLESRQAFLS